MLVCLGYLLVCDSFPLLDGSVTARTSSVMVRLTVPTMKTKETVRRLILVER